MCQNVFKFHTRVDVTQLLYTSSDKLCAYELDNTAPQFVEPDLGINFLKTREAFNWSVRAGSNFRHHLATLFS